ncbi:hypothetical protein As57867_005931, partial [Aphanomyces stellatus]
MRATIFVAVVATAVAQSTLPVSVVGDATYRVFGPICSGSGAIPAGVKCPVKGDEAIESCLPSLRSYSNGKCVAPVDAACQKIPSGAWGCVWSSDAKTALPTTARPVAPTSATPTTVVPAITTLGPRNSTNASNATRSNDTITA